MTKVRVESLSLTYGGKGAAVRRQVGKEVENICLCWHNADLSSGCISQVPVELLGEVVENDGKYAPGNFGIYKAKGIIKGQKCGYCYGRGLNNGNVKSRVINKKTRDSFKKYKPDVIRLGKFTEPGHPFYYKTLMGFLNLCKEFNSSLIFPTKALCFGIQGAKETIQYARNNNTSVYEIAKSMRMAKGEEVAEKLKDIDAAVNYSLGWNGLELGLTSQGFTNEFRINQVRYFQDCDVNVSLTLVSDLGQSIKENAKLGSPIKRALEMWEKGTDVRLLPLRINTKKVSEFLYGCKYKGIIFDDNLVTTGLEGVLGFPVVKGVERKPYQHKKNGSAQDLIIKFAHPDFQKLIDEGMGVCGQIGDFEYCDKCNIEHERIKFHVSELAEKIRRKTYLRKKRDKSPAFKDIALKQP